MSIINKLLRPFSAHTVTPEKTASIIGNLACQHSLDLPSDEAPKPEVASVPAQPQSTISSFTYQPPCDTLSVEEPKPEATPVTTQPQSIISSIAYQPPCDTPSVEEPKPEATPVTTQPQSTISSFTYQPSCDAPSIDEPKPSAKITLATYFAEKGFDLQLDSQNADITPIESLAVFLAINHSHCRFFLQYLRDNLCKKNYSINYFLAKIPENAKSSILAVAKKLATCGIISNFHHHLCTDSITGTISSAPRVINFLNGDYLEFFARKVAEKVVQEAAFKYDTDHELFNNVILSKDGKSHEVDILFRVGEHVFWSEIKSGHFSEYDAYRKLGKWLDVNPYRHILLSAEVEKEASETISWLYEFYVANIMSFKNKLWSMIDNAFGKGGANHE